MTEPLQPFYDYLMERRRALLTELDEIEKILGTTPRISEIRKNYKISYASANKSYQKHKGDNLETNTPPSNGTSKLVECGSVSN